MQAIGFIRIAGKLTSEQATQEDAFGEHVKNHPSFSRNSDQQPVIRLFVVSGIGLTLGMALVFAAMLREAPIFWRNAGGFPILLRDLVEWLFYPALAGFSLAVLVATLLAIRWPRELPLHRLAWLAVMVQWFLLLAVFAIAFWNNINNWISDAPLHQHLQ